MPFVKGQRGNPAGRPTGSRNKRARLVEDLLEGESQTPARRAIAKAMPRDKGGAARQWKQ